MSKNITIEQFEAALSPLRSAVEQLKSSDTKLDAKLAETYKLINELSVKFDVIHAGETKIPATKKTTTRKKKAAADADVKDAEDGAGDLDDADTETPSLSKDLAKKSDQNSSVESKTAKKSVRKTKTKTVADDDEAVVDNEVADDKVVANDETPADAVVEPVKKSAKSAVKKQVKKTDEPNKTTVESVEKKAIVKKAVKTTDQTTKTSDVAEPAKKSVAKPSTAKSSANNSTAKSSAAKSSTAKSTAISSTGNKLPARFNVNNYFNMAYDSDQTHFDTYLNNEVKNNIANENAANWKGKDESTLHALKRTAYYNYMRDNHRDILTSMKDAYISEQNSVVEDAVQKESVQA